MQQDNNETLVIELNGKIYTITPNEFSSEIDIKDCLKIEHHNILGEILTFPCLMNKIANLTAEIRETVSKQKFGIDILKATLEENFKAKRAGQKTTVADVEGHVILNVDYQNEQTLLFRLNKQLNIMESFYWSAQAKMESLKKLSDKIQPEEFTSDILEKSVNNYMIRKFNGKL